MSPVRYRYTFAPSVEMGQVEAVLALAVAVVEDLFGEAAVRLDVAYDLDLGGRSCVLSADTEVARDCNRIFAGLLSRELADDAFRVERIEGAAGRQRSEIPVGAS